jgi:hypothetical protein
MSRALKRDLEKEIERLRQEIAQSDELMKQVLFKVEALRGHCLSVQNEVETWRKAAAVAPREGKRPARKRSAAPKPGEPPG